MDIINLGIVGITVGFVCFWLGYIAGFNSSNNDDEYDRNLNHEENR